MNNEGKLVQRKFVMIYVGKHNFEVCFNFRNKKAIALCIREIFIGQQIVVEI